MEKKHLLKTGEFARLCRTTKETLLHYDRKGLLKPRYVADNGYRWYGAEQFFHFDLISLLKESGCSLEEIRRSRNLRERHRYPQFLRERIALLEEEQRRLARRLSMLRGFAALTREATTRSFDTLFFEEREAERGSLLSRRSGKNDRLHNAGGMLFPLPPGQSAAWEHRRCAARKRYSPGSCRQKGIQALLPVPPYLQQGRRRHTANALRQLRLSAA